MTELELRLDEGRPARAGHFFRAGADLLALLDELSDETVEWVLSGLELGSSVVRVAAPPTADTASDQLRRAMGGLTSMESGQPAPTDWNPDALAAAQRLASVDDSSLDQAAPPPRLTLIDGGRSTESMALTRKLAARLAELQPAVRSMPGAVRGQVVGINVARGNRASLKSSSGNVIKVTFGDDLRVPLRDALYRDVELSGQIRQATDGRVFHVKAEELRALPKPRIRWSDLFGIDPDITGGLSVSEYLETARGQA